MKRYTLMILAVLICIPLGYGLASVRASAALTNAVYLPSVSMVAAPSTCDGQAPLTDTDVGALSVIRDAAGNYIVAYQDRYDGSRAHVARHVGNHLEELAGLTQETVPSSMPSFSPEGQKQGAVALVPDGPTWGRRFYYTEREQDATPNEGPYVLWCVEF